jgi:hypothetical protein
MHSWSRRPEQHPSYHPPMRGARRNVLLTAERRGRLSEASSTRVLARNFPQRLTHPPTVLAHLQAPEAGTSAAGADSVTGGGGGGGCELAVRGLIRYAPT